MTTDAATAAYFDAHADDEDDPTQVRKELTFLLDFLRRTATAESTLLEIGCGQGTVLKILRDGTPIRTLWGCDISAQSLARAKGRTGCHALHGSILDDAFVAGISERFDYVVVRAVLHHLVGGTRRQSRTLVAHALRNALGLLKPGGYLLILEPTYGPPALMTVLFYVKRLVTTFTDRRVVMLGHHDHNVGAPLVSYLTADQLAGMLGGLDGRLRDFEVVKRRVRRVMRWAGVKESGIVSAVVRTGSQ